ncbi:MAG: NACHT domain-containing protein [Cyanobacteriota bacterium]|nr:NACHT domain-containing protein [Cyanobacteriota bacterium]
MHDKTLIELGLEERTDAVVSNQNLERQTANEAPKSLPKGTKVTTIFDQLGEGGILLILGEPGAGKTTALLELARDLLNRAEQGLDYRIPVVFNLSSWTGEERTIGHWLVGELHSKYQVPQPIGSDWVEKQELLLLLDGLNEVKAEWRESCAAALNDFNRQYAPEMVVCSRTQDYSHLSPRFECGRAIGLKSLTLEQVIDSLNRNDTDFTELKMLIKEDRTLQKLAESPLMLNIMLLAYEGVSIKNLSETEVVEERRKQLFDAYIERMLCRPTRLKIKQSYSATQTKDWLTWLAGKMLQESQTLFLIERMQLTELREKNQRILCRLLIFLMSLLLSWPIGGIIAEVTFGFSADLGDLLIAWLFYGLIYGLSCGLLSVFLTQNEIGQTLLTWKWYWQEATNGRRRLILASLVGVVLFYGRGLNSIVELIVLLSCVLNMVLILGGGKISIQHFALRLILYGNGDVPWNYAHFLDYAAERIFLQKVGSGYIFIHRLLLEYFAQLSRARAASFERKQSSSELPPRP